MYASFANVKKLPLVECYPGQLNQVFMNLLSNAIDALEETNAGKTYSEVEKNPNIITIRTFATDNQVTISIADNGLGMNEEVRQRLFEVVFLSLNKGKSPQTENLDENWKTFGME